LTMIDAFDNACRFTDQPPESILPAFTENPARQAGVSLRKGSLESGKDADFIILDSNGSLRATYVRGTAVYRA
ncbi:MAG: amidohydrolase family protein, partial [Clostridia bacterium]|nr:amidohydrolase family protein [Clostridia bacterium]